MVFPKLQQPGFGFEDPDNDVFANMGLRSRLNRMGNPFDWSARKRRGSGQNATDPYEHYFQDDVDFPHFGSTWDAFNRVGNKRSQQPNDRSGFFEYLPQEFRQYMPDNFGHFNRQMHPQQPKDVNQPPQEQPTQTQQSNLKSNLCDAAIQTDDLDNQSSNNSGKNQSSASQSTPSDNDVHRSSSSASR